VTVVVVAVVESCTRATPQPRRQKGCYVRPGGRRHAMAATTRTAEGAAPAVGGLSVGMEGGVPSTLTRPAVVGSGSGD